LEGESKPIAFGSHFSECLFNKKYALWFWAGGTCGCIFAFVEVRRARIGERYVMEFNTVLFSVSVVAFTIGVHQSFYYGIEGGYWLFMLSGLSYLWLNYRRRQDTKKNVGELAGKIAERSAAEKKKRKKK